MIPIIIQISNKNYIETRNLTMLNNMPIIVYLLNRIKQETSAQITLITSTLSVDNVFCDIATSCKVDIIRGKYNHIIEQLKLAANHIVSDYFVRLFIANPLVDLEAMIQLATLHEKGNFDYSYNEHSQGVLYGTGCEIFSKKCINLLYDMGLNIKQQETLSYFVQENTEKFKVLKHCIVSNRQNYKLKYETEKDLFLINYITKLKHINNKCIVEYLKENSEFINQNVIVPSKEVSVDKILFHPSKLTALLNQSNFDESYPISVELTLTNECNLKCVYCSDNELRKKQGKTSSINIETLKVLFLDLVRGGTKGIVIEGGGEPTLHRHFEEVVRYAKKIGLAVGLITNGTIKIKKTVIKQLEWIRVSLDASTEKEYIDIKGINLFEQVLNNIGEYVSNCKTVGVGYVLTLNNISNIESLVLRVKQIGVSYIQIRPVVDCPELYPHNINLSYLNLYQSNHFCVNIDGMIDNSSHGNFQLSCTANSLTSVITGDGSVYICGRLNIYSWFKPLGNIKDQSFNEIWTGEERKKQHKMLQDEKFCETYCPQCRISKFNLLFSQLYKVNSINFI